ncbi:MAG: amino acid permease [Alphaproteobacteria bacterium]|nr:amino acid permease [Alphaproteobacteria bacterium]
MTRRKPIEQVQAEYEGGELKRTLGPINLVLLGIGCIIGTGIFVLTGRAAAVYAGPGIMISFIITGTLCAFVALCYAELASFLPVSGSAYSYSYVSMGEFAAWIMGLLLVLEYGLAASTVAVGWSGYVVSFLHDVGIHIPAVLTAAPGVDVVTQAGEHVTAVANLPAIIGIVAVTALLVVGISESATVNNIIVFIKVTVVIAFIVIGFFYVKTSLWQPLIPPEVKVTPDGTLIGAVGGTRSFLQQLNDAFIAIFTGDSSTRYGIGGVIHGAAVIFFAYIGFEAVSTAGAESKNPARDMPIGILGSLIICTVLYILTSGVLVGIVPYAKLDDPAPIALAVNEIGLKWFAVLVKIGAIAGLSSVMLVLVYGQTRIFYTMARDGLLPSPLAAVHKKFQTPWINTLFVGVIASAFAGFMSLDKLADLTNVGTLAAFMIVCLTVIYLRITHPHEHRPFTTPDWFSVISLGVILAAVVSIFLLEEFPTLPEPWIVVTGLAVALTVLLYILRKPLRPLLRMSTPLMGTAMCFILLMSLMTNPHARGFFTWYLIIGILLYFGYGFWFSKLAKGHLTPGPAE